MNGGSLTPGYVSHLRVSSCHRVAKVTPKDVTVGRSWGRAQNGIDVTARKRDNHFIEAKALDWHNSRNSQHLLTHSPDV